MKKIDVKKKTKGKNEAKGEKEKCIQAKDKER